jgi:transposase
MPIGLPAGSKIYLSLAPVDMRKGFDGLAAQVQHILSRNLFSGHLPSMPAPAAILASPGPR